LGKWREIDQKSGKFWEEKSYDCYIVKFCFEIVPLKIPPYLICYKWSFKDVTTPQTFCHTALQNIDVTFLNTENQKNRVLKYLRCGATFK